MSEVISRLADATPAWLSTILREAGYISQGSVVSAEQRVSDAFNSSTAHLRLVYSEEATATPPQDLVLKLQKNHDGENEVQFYRLVAQLGANLPMLAPCFALDYDAQSGNSYLLLEDLSPTHVEPVTRQQLLEGQGVPRADQLDGIADAIAGFHAYWWEHPDLGKYEATAIRPWWRDKETYQQHVERRTREWNSFKQSAASEVSPQIRATYEYVLGRMPALWEEYLEERITQRRQLTLTQGDCYLSNLLCPREVAGEAEEPKGQTYILDLEAVSANFPTYDLAYLMPTFWSPEQRKVHRPEELFLIRYLQRLRKFGVENYNWAMLWRDYQMMVVFMLFDPIWDQTAGASRAYWYPKLHCLVRNFWDMGCGLTLRKLAEKK